jgi:HTH-type transcriptional regulator/antitoxin HigA
MFHDPDALSEFDESHSEQEERWITMGNADYRRIRQQIPLGVLRTEAEYNHVVAALDNILDEIGERETHPLADLAETLALSIEAYDDAHVAIPDASGPDILRSLTAEHELAQSDLPEIGSQGVVSKILSGKRDLNVRQIAQLAARFDVSPALFIPVSTRDPKLFPTNEDYRLIPDDGKRHEVIGGEHVMSPSPNTKHQRTSGTLFNALKNFFREHPVGEVFHAPYDVVLSEFDVVQPI